MFETIDTEARQRLISVLELKPERRRHVIKIVLYHGKEYGLEEDVSNLLQKCCSDEYAEEVRKALI